MLDRVHSNEKKAAIDMQPCTPRTSNAAGWGDPFVVVTLNWPSRREPLSRRPNALQATSADTLTLKGSF